ncbi:MAG: hypothetical protein JO257_29330 [Deltaproteobacteria bacterium]|nr:hypothetical protein [Deltaproteobacteria bacterium]
MRTLLVLVLLAGAAHADHPRYTRPSAAPPPPKSAVATKPKPPVPGKPAVTAETILEQDEDNQPIYVEQEAILEQLVHDTPDTEADKPDLMFRLAEHYAKQWRFFTIEENERQLGKR